MGAYGHDAAEVDVPSKACVFISKKTKMTIRFLLIHIGFMPLG